MKKYFIISLIPVLLAGCTLFKSQRAEIIPNRPELDYNDRDAIRQQADINFDIADNIEKFGTTSHSPESIVLRDGTKILISYLGNPWKEVDGNDLKESRKIIERTRGIVEDYSKDVEKYEDKLDRTREKQINGINNFWDWKKLFSGGFITIIVVGGGLLIAAIFFPVLLPIIQILWQLLRGGIGAFAIFAKLGVTGVTNVVSAVESFRNQNKGTQAGQVFDTHMKSSLPTPTQTALDRFKNHYDI